MGQALRLDWASGPSTAARRDGGPSAEARTYLGSYHLGNCTFGKLPLGKLSLGKLSLGKWPLGKYLTPWKKSFVKDQN